MRGVVMGVASTIEIWRVAHFHLSFGLESINVRDGQPAPNLPVTVVKLETIQLERTETKQIRETRSICPECNKVLPATVFEREGKIWISKACSDHGEVEEQYFGSTDMYYKFVKFSHNGKGIENPNVPLEKCACPTNCGLCTSHLSPDMRIIPFCAFNVIPEWYRDAIQPKYGIPIEQWEREHGTTIEQGLYKGRLRKGKVMQQDADAHLAHSTLQAPNY